MRITALFLIAVFTMEASARWWWSKPTCVDYLRNETVDMRVTEIYDKDVFEDALDTREHADLDIRPLKKGRFSMRIGASVFTDKDEGFDVFEEEIGIFILSFRDRPIMKIEVSGDIALGFIYENGDWRKFARFSR